MIFLILQCLRLTPTSAITKSDGYLCEDALKHRIESTGSDQTKSLKYIKKRKINRPYFSLNHPYSYRYTSGILLSIADYQSLSHDNELTKMQNAPLCCAFLCLYFLSIFSLKMQVMTSLLLGMSGWSFDKKVFMFLTNRLY